MQSNQIPTKFQIPFGKNAAAGTIRTIPVADQTATSPGAASLTTGFPPATGQPLASGGIPPSMQDFNGLLNQDTAWAWWQSAGGTVQFDQAFCNAVGGYPSGAILASTTAGILWLNTVDNNTTNPDSSSSQNWVKVISQPQLIAGIKTTTFQNATATPLSNGAATTVVFADPSTVDFQNNGAGTFTCLTAGAYQINFNLSIGVSFNQSGSNDVFARILFNGASVGFNKSPFFGNVSGNYFGFVTTYLQANLAVIAAGTQIQFAAGVTVPTGFVSAAAQNHVATFTRMF